MIVPVAESPLIGETFGDSQGTRNRKRWDFQHCFARRIESKQLSLPLGVCRGKD